MKKTILLLGLGYILWGLWQLFSSLRMISLYQEFGASAPRVALLFPIGILGYGVIQIVAYFAKPKNEKVYKMLFFVGLILVGLWVLYVLAAGNVANRQIDTVLNEINQPESGF